MRPVVAALGVVAAVGLIAFVVAPMFQPAPVTEVEPPREAAKAPPEKRVSETGLPLGIEGKQITPQAKAPRPPPRPAREDTPPPPSGEVEALNGLEIDNATASELQDLKVPEGQTGVIVRFVDPGSPAAEALLRKNDVIVRAQRDKIDSRDALRAAVGDRDHTLLTVYRDGYPFQVVLHKPFRGETAKQ